MGLHDLDSEIIEAVKASRSSQYDVFLTALQDRLLSQLSTLKDEIALNRVHTFALLIRDNFVSLKVAHIPALLGSAIFHNKRFMFLDSEGNRVTGSSGMNETVMGLTRNYDDVTFNFSWEANDDRVQAHVASFEKLWNGQSDEIEVSDIDDDFVMALIERTKPRQYEKVFEQVSEDKSKLKALISNSTEYFFHSFPKVTLYPHQERVVMDAVSDFPVRKMLADEVGLGKTLEAGAILRYLSALDPNSSTVIACPSNLMNQWRDEMQTHFGQEFWKWIPSESRYESSTGKSWPAPSGMPFDGDIPQRIVISRNLLATEKYRTYLEGLADLKIGTLVIDESHAARINKDLSGKINTSKTWYVAKKLSEMSSNCLLLTATPLQLDVLELYGQLALLGLSGSWDSTDNFIESVRFLAEFPEDISLNEASTLGQLIVDATRSLFQIPELTTQEAQLMAELTSTVDSFEISMLIQSRLPLARAVFLKVHPAHNLVIRNTRSSLREIGYTFPTRVHSAPEITAAGGLQGYFQLLDRYLNNDYGRIEAAINPDGGSGYGLAVSTYYQRVASSLSASRASLNRRLNRANLVRETIAATNSLFIDPATNNEETELELEESLDSEAAEPTLDFEILLSEELLQARKHSILHAAQTEALALDQIITQLDELYKNLSFADPKYERALQIISEELQGGPVVVFSKYTDTLFGFLDYLSINLPEVASSGLGFYTGKSVWLSIDGNRLLADKSAVVDAMFAGAIQILLCSDAASEGLNLQASGCIINLDVPWNPARLEQRIGRIDRLGQRRSEVHIFNLWYPDSVEAKIYSRLLARKELMEVAVGKYPSLMADSISAKVSEKYGKVANSRTGDDLELYRDRAQERSLEKIWSDSKDFSSRSREIRDKVLSYFARSDEWQNLVSDLVIEEGLPETFNLLHPKLDHWWDSPPASTGNASVVAVLGSNRVLMGLCLQTEKSGYLLKHESIAALFECLLIAGGKPLDVSSHATRFEPGSVGQLDIAKSILERSARVGTHIEVTLMPKLIFEDIAIRLEVDE